MPKVAKTSGKVVFLFSKVTPSVSHWVFMPSVFLYVRNGQLYAKRFATALMPSVPPAVYHSEAVALRHLFASLSMPSVLRFLAQLSLYSSDWSGVSDHRRELVRG